MPSTSYVIKADIDELLDSIDNWSALLDEAKEKLDSYERHVRLNDPCHTELSQAKNDTQRRQIIEYWYLMAEKDKWTELRTEVHKCTRMVESKKRRLKAKYKILRSGNF